MSEDTIAIVIQSWLERGSIVLSYIIQTVCLFCDGMVELEKQLTAVISNDFHMTSNNPLLSIT